MNLQTLRNIAILLIFAAMITACNMPSNPTEIPTVQPSATHGAPTRQVIPTNTRPVVSPTAQPTQVPPTSTSEPTATSTLTSTATATATPTSATCTDLAKFVDDVTIPDDTEVLP
jgi:septal ring-binding cell division protein DamX